MAPLSHSRLTLISVALGGWLAFAPACQLDAAALDLVSVLHKADGVAGWRMQGEPATYTRATLFDYINGGADFYLGYAFRQAVVADYIGAGGAKITVELYDMGSSYDAFGVFAHDRGAQSKPIGQESSWGNGVLTFWKDRLFARLFADRDSEQVRQGILRLGKALSTSVRTRGAKPPLLRFLPPAGLAATSVRYLHTDTALNRVLYLPGNPLRLNHKTEVACGEYPTGDVRIKLVVVSYADVQEAGAGLRGVGKLHGARPPEHAPPGVHSGTYVRETERYGWVGGFARERYVIVVSDAPSEGAAQRLLESVRKRVAAGAERT